MRLGAGSGEPNGDSPGLAKITDVSHNVVLFRIIWRDNGWGAVSANGGQETCRNFRSALDDVFCQRNIAFEAIRRLLNTMESLSISKSPIVFVEKESRMFSTGPFIGGQKYRECGAANMPHGMHMDSNGELANKVVEGH